MGEPVTLPPYSLSPHQSSRITTEAENQVAAITADYRRFRVKAEMTRKTLDAQIRDVQAANVETTKRQIEGQEQQHAAAAAAAAQENSIGGTKTAADMMVLQMSSSPHANAEEDSKVSYLKNLMVNYLTADPEVRDHMEVAIGTVLKFTPDDIAAIGQKKEAEASWGIFLIIVRI